MQRMYDYQVSGVTLDAGESQSDARFGNHDAIFWTIFGIWAFLRETRAPSIKSSGRTLDGLYKHGQARMQAEFFCLWTLLDG